MARREFDLKSLLDIPLWEKVQDELAKLTGTAIITVDFKGNPITKHSGRTEFCSVIRENPVSRKRCYRCDSLAGLEAVRLGRPYIYLCHCGIVDVAVPVLVGDRYLGAVMFGEVRLPKNAEAEAKVERLVSEISSFQAESRNARSDLLEMYERLPEMEYASIVQVADTINAMVNYIIDRAVNRENEVMTYEYLLHGAGGPASGAQREIEELRMPEPEKREAGERLSKSSPVYPAVEYVRAHMQEMVKMVDMAHLCHLSPSYFSRVFHREMGENFINWMNRQKVEEAKRRLRAGNETVNQIALELGYLDPSYFINVFRRFEGITPLVYRQYRYK